MSSSKRRPVSGDDEPVAMSVVLPDEVVFDILIRLPGKQIGRCKCVCKPWRTIIRSRPFLEIYRKRNRGLLIYWAENFNTDGDVCTRRLNFSFCPLRRYGEPPEELSPLSEIKLRQYSGLERSTALKEFRPYPRYRHQNGMSQMVDGLLCVGEQVESGSSFSFGLSLHNVCTGEMMKLPDPLPNTDSSTYHLGYDPVNKVYKLLRLIFRDQRAHILTLSPPSGSQSTWRELDYNRLDHYRDRKNGISEVTSCPDEGKVWWLYKYSISSESKGVAWRGDLLCFDFSMEMFQYVEAPRDYCFEGHLIFQAITRFKDSLALWLPSDKREKYVIFCYVLEDDGGKIWSKQSLEISKVLKESGYFVLPSGQLQGSSSSSGNMLVMDRISTRRMPLRVYSCSARQTPHDAYNDDLFYVGKIPSASKFGTSIYFQDPNHQWRCLHEGFGKVSCLLNGNNLHLPLDDILGGDSATM